MPTLIWPTKSLVEPNATSITDEAIVFPNGKGSQTSRPRNRLILGDNLPIMGLLNAEFEGKIDLIYADPPFFTNRHFTTRIGHGEDSRQPKKWQLAPGYGDRWQELDAYLDFLYPRLVLMHRLLSPRGSLYLHLDWHAAAQARLLLDEIFGRERFLNEIIWTYHGPSAIRRAFNRKHDNILVYTKSDQYIFNADAIREPYHPNTVKTFLSSSKAGFGKKPDLARGKIPEDWWYFPVVARLHNERNGYPTQKPEALLERILLASSDPGSIVADFFCGSGTFPAIASRHRRDFIACDETWRAIHTTRVRLIKENTPFLLQRDTQVNIPTRKKKVKYSRTERGILLQDTDDFDYWEIDPDWNGELFHSHTQAYRHFRTGILAPEIIPEREMINPRVRLITIQGDQIEF